MLSLSSERAKRRSEITEVLRTSEYLTERLLRDGVISADERDIVQYGLETLQGTLSSCVLSTVIGFCFGNVCAGIGLFLLIFPLRKYAGGYHADTKSGCFVTSALMMVMTFFGLYLWHWPKVVYCIIVMLFDMVIIWMAPMENQNKRLDDAEQTMYRKRTRAVLLVENVLFVLACLLNGWEVFCVITMSIVFTGLSLMMGLVKLRNVQKTSKIKTLR